DLANSRVGPDRRLVGAALVALRPARRLVAAGHAQRLGPRHHRPRRVRGRRSRRLRVLVRERARAAVDVVRGASRRRHEWVRRLRPPHDEAPAAAPSSPGAAPSSPRAVPGLPDLDVRAPGAARPGPGTPIPTIPDSPPPPPAEPPLIVAAPQPQSPPQPAAP